MVPQCSPHSLLLIESRIPNQRLLISTADESSHLNAHNQGSSLQAQPGTSSSLEAFYSKSCQLTALTITQEEYNQEILANCY